MPHKEEMVHGPWREQESGLREQRVGGKQFTVDGWQFTGKAGGGKGEALKFINFLIYQI